MSKSDSDAFAPVFDDAHSPVFSQREAAHLSGVEQKAISNWLDRGFVRRDDGEKGLELLNGRPQSGRRLFSRQQVLTLRFVSFLMKSEIGVTDAFAMAKVAVEEAKKAHAADKLSFVIPERMLDLAMWVIFARGTDAETETSPEHDFWAFEPVISPKAMMMFSTLDGEIFKATGYFASSPVICLPVAGIIGSLSSEIHMLLAADLDSSMS